MPDHHQNLSERSETQASRVRNRAIPERTKPKSKRVITLLTHEHLIPEKYLDDLTAFKSNRTYLTDLQKKSILRDGHSNPPVFGSNSQKLINFEEIRQHRLSKDLLSDQRHASGLKEDVPSIRIVNQF